MALERNAIAFLQNLKAGRVQANMTHVIRKAPLQRRQELVAAWEATDVRATDFQRFVARYYLAKVRYCRGTEMPMLQAAAIAKRWHKRLKVELVNPSLSLPMAKVHVLRTLDDICRKLALLPPPQAEKASKAA